MSNNTSVERYIAYLRKSDERDEKQILSIPAQKEQISKQFPDLNIIDFVEESKSAFKPYNRPEFDNVIKRLENGEAEGLLAWHPNRLSRNEIDAATVTFRVRKHVIKDLRFCAYTFENSPEGIMMLQIIMSQSQYESSKQARDVKRGMKQKASGGERPGQVPLGYKKVPVLDKDGEPIMHAKETKFVTRTERDPERFDMVKRMWTMMLSGTYSAPQIRKIANEVWGFKTKVIHKRNSVRAGNRPMGPNQIYRIFNNLFYAGWLVHENETSKGNHEPMVTLDQFDYVQMLLKEKGKPRTDTFEYAYTGLMVCGECGCAINGKHRRKFIVSSQSYFDYIYYHCNRKSETRPCTQNKYTRVEEIEATIDAELAKYTILPEFRDLALEILNRDHKVEVQERKQIYQSQQNRRVEIQDQLDSLIELRTRGDVDDEEYTRARNKLKMQLEKSDELLRGTEIRAEDWLELTEKAFNFATYARIHYANGTPRQKREIMMTLGQNLVLKDGIVTLTPNEWLVPIGKSYPAIEKAYLRARTKQKATSPDSDMALAGISESWRARRDLNPRHPA